ncbi:abortive infection family protein [Sinomonas susongensis]|uniref:abortive infection family protein n=1 Tax=Sinomonas susongensis TaxID=1324851 RepID=UPI001BB23C56|nr:abortive infection family protein [Sinomonas susongensis]
MTALTKQQVMRLVNRYIGVSGGYLGDFSYRTHADFYPEYCGIYDVETDAYEGTTRQRFIEILLSRTPHDQAKILRGVIAKFGESDGSNPERLALRSEIETWALEVERGPSVATPSPTSTRDVVVRALVDADTLLRTSGPISAVDRIHTALHGHLLSLCDAASIVLPSDPSITVALKALRENHPRMHASGARSADVTQVLYAMSNVLDKLNTIRNNASLAHPNQTLLNEPEARLAINAGKTVFAYVDEKLGIKVPKL